jgi:hypothetical protein
MRITDCQAVAPLSTANSMRVARLCVPCMSFLDSQDIIVTSDADMLPVSRTWFADPPKFGHLRAGGGWRTTHKGQRFDPHKHADDVEQIGMCYASATAEKWRSLFPELVPNDVYASLRRLAGDSDRSDRDETLLSQRFIRPSGGLEIRDPVDAPIVGETGQPGMAGRWNDSLRGVRGLIDVVTPRCSLDKIDWAPIDCVRSCFPELETWALAYQERVRVALGKRAG